MPSLTRHVSIQKRYFSPATLDLLQAEQDDGISKETDQLYWCLVQKLHR